MNRRPYFYNEKSWMRYQYAIQCYFKYVHIKIKKGYLIRTGSGLLLPNGTITFRDGKNLPTIAIKTKKEYKNDIHNMQVCNYNYFYTFDIVDDKILINSDKDQIKQFFLKLKFINTKRGK